ncbi:MAG: extracellular solute-binding protein, partial [Lysobacter sp.]
LIWLGRDPNAGAADELDAVRKVYAAIRPYVRTFNNAEYKDAFANGDACLVMGYSGDIAQAVTDAFDAAKKAGAATPNLRFAIPKEGAIRWVDVIAVPKDSKHQGNAHAFINYLLDPKVSAQISNHVAYATANKDATTLVDPAIAQDPGVYPPEAVRAKLVDPRSLPEDVQRQRVRAWTSIKSGH